MGAKWGRNYELSIQTEDGGTLEIGLPFTLELDITRNTLTSANVCQLRLHNLAPLDRNQIRFNVSNYGQFRAVQLKAGYGDNLPVIFSGNISSAWSIREGVNFISQIECYDGGFAFNTGRVNTSFPKGTPRTSVIRGLAAQGLPQTKVGAVGESYSGTLTRGNTFSGPTMQILGEYTGGGAFIDGGVFNALGTDEYLVSPGGIVVVDASSGLLGTPVLEQTIVRFNMLFEPSLNVGTQILLDSNTGESFNGAYKVTAVKHRGVISGAVSGSVITTGEFFYSKQLTPAGF